MQNIFDAFARFTASYWFVWVYIVLINIITFIVFCVDKRKAEKGRWRIRESVLFLLGFIGGSLGGLLAMYTAHHKTRKQKFVSGFSLFLLLHIFIVLWLVMKA